MIGESPSRDPKQNPIIQHPTLKINLWIGLSPFPVIVTTRIITFLVGNPYKPSFATITGKGDNPTYGTQNHEGLDQMIFLQKDGDFQLPPLAIPRLKLQSFKTCARRLQGKGREGGKVKEKETEN